MFDGTTPAVVRPILSAVQRDNYLLKWLSAARRFQIRPRYPLFGMAFFKISTARVHPRSGADEDAAPITIRPVPPCQKFPKLVH